MSFPTSPINGQQAVLNGITYTYSSANTSWTRLVQGITATVSLSLSSTTQSTSTTTGALVVAGGIGVGGNIYSGGIHVIQNSTNASSTTTGALIVQGGAGIAGNAYIGGNVYTNGSIILPTSIQEFTATGGQTLFTIAGGYTVGTIQVFANGVQLASSDYTASNGTSVSLNTPRVSGDIIRTVNGLTSSSINNITARTLAYAVVFG
jgi:hypothetical protein